MDKQWRHNCGTLVHGIVVLLCAVLFLMFAGPAAAQDDVAQDAGRLIGRVILDVPSALRDPVFLTNIKDLKENLPAKTGDLYSKELIQETIRTIFQYGLFSQVRAFADFEDERVTLIFELKPNTIVGDVTFEGNDSLASDDLMRVVQLRKGDKLFAEDLRAAEKKLKAHYRRNGFLETKVSGSIDPMILPYRAKARFQIEEGPRVYISRIDFGGDLFFSQAKVRRKLPLKPGDPVDLDTIYSAIETLRLFYIHSGFDEVEIKLVNGRVKYWRYSPLFQQGVVQISIRAGRRIDLRFIGNKHYSPLELQTALDIDPEKVLAYGFATRKKLRRRLVEFYQRQGYLHAEVRSRTTLVGPREKVISFYIHEGRRVKLDLLAFENNKAFDDDRLSDEMLQYVRERLATEDEDSLKPPQMNVFKHFTWRTEPNARTRVNWEMPIWARPEPLDSDEVYIPDIYYDAARSLEQFYVENGYLSAVLGDPTLDYSLTGQRLVVTFPTSEGVQTTIRSIRIRGLHVFNLEDVLKWSKMTIGAALNPLGFEDVKKRIKTRYDEKGHIFADMDFSYELSRNRKHADLTLIIREGPQVRVGQIIVSGVQITDPAVVKRELTFNPGDVYKPSEMDDSQRWVSKLGIFQAVTLKPWDPEKIEPVKRVVVDVIERTPGRFEVSAGVATDEGVRVGTAFVYRNLGGKALEFHARAKANHRIPPLLDAQFQRLYERLDFTEALERELSVGIYYPSILGSHIGYRTDLVHTRKQERAYGQNKNSIIFGFDTELWRHLTLAWMNEFSQLDTKHTKLPPLRPGLIIPPAGTSWEYSPKLQSIFDYRDSVFNPTKGVVISGLAEYFETLSGQNDIDLFRGQASVAGYIPIPIMRRPPVLKLTGRIGGIVLASGKTTPIDKTFKLGGRNSVRGFGEEAIYPSDLSDAEVISLVQNDVPSYGGNAFLLFKVDLRVPVYKSYAVGAFTDFGNLWLHRENINLDFAEYKKSAGGGIHYRTPVGDISLEIGWNLDRKKEFAEDSWRLHFSINLF